MINLEDIAKTAEYLRAFEKEMAELYEQGKIKAPIHLAYGNEEPLIRIFREVNTDDWVCASYRDHYHALLKNIPKEWLKEQIIKGNSMYPLNKEYKFITSAIVSGQLPIALGIAKALKLKNKDNSVWAFCGDMAAETGVFHEVTKYAENHNLPITFVIEDNSLSVDTPTEVVWNGYDLELKENTIRYPYKTGVPHQGLGKEVGF